MPVPSIRRFRRSNSDEEMIRRPSALSQEDVGEDEGPAGQTGHEDESGPFDRYESSEMLQTLSDLMQQNPDEFRQEVFDDLIAAGNAFSANVVDEEDGASATDDSTDGRDSASAVTVVDAKSAIAPAPPPPVALTAAEIEESKALFSEECDFLLNMYDPDQCEVAKCRETGHCKSIRVQILPQRVLDTALAVRNRKSTGFVLNVIWRAGYPATRGPEVTIEPWHNLLTRNEVDDLYRELAESVTNFLGGPMLSNVCGVALAKVELFVSKAEDVALSLPEAFNARIRNSGIQRTRDPTKTLAPSQYIGNVSDLLALIPKRWDVINVENVLKEDLALRFDKMQRFLYNKHVAKYENDEKLKRYRLQDHIQAMADITPAFHGTRMDNIGRIVRNGLLVPGGESGVKRRTGSRYGNGIYASPVPEFALGYAEHGHDNHSSVKVMIVAVLLGKVKVILDGHEPWGGGCSPGFDSHMSQRGEQFCVFHEWQVLPCYVIHLMERSYDREHHNITGKLDAAGKIPVNASRKTRADILTALARKNLPFGFGPAGGKFVVEEIADYSDDEEDWGEYQGQVRDGFVYEEFQHETLLNPSVQVNRTMDPNNQGFQKQRQKK